MKTSITFSMLTLAMVLVGILDVVISLSTMDNVYYALIIAFRLFLYSIAMLAFQIISTILFLVVRFKRKGRYRNNGLNPTALIFNIIGWIPTSVAVIIYLRMMF